MRYTRRRTTHPCARPRRATTNRLNAGPLPDRLRRVLFGHALTLDEHQLLIGTLDQGIQQVPLEAGLAFRGGSISVGSPVLSSQRVDAFLWGPDALYALIDGNLLRRSGTAWMPALPLEPSARSNANISALAFAPDGTLYIGFFDHGLDLLTAEGAIRHIENDALFCINRLVVDPQRHTMDAATADGLVLFDAQGRPRQTLTHRAGLISDPVTDISFSNSGTVLATPAGIAFLGLSEADQLTQRNQRGVQRILRPRQHERKFSSKLGGEASR